VTILGARRWWLGGKRRQAAEKEVCKGERKPKGEAIAERRIGSGVYLDSGKRE